MRIDRISLQNYPPIKSFEIQTSSNMVIIAGANGSGKTRLKGAITYSFGNPAEPQISLSLTATRPEEEIAWNMKTIEVTAGKDCPTLREYLYTRIKEQSYIGTVIQIESNRTVQPIRFESFPLATVDPANKGTIILGI